MRRLSLTLEIEGTPIELVRSAKFLGIVFDSDLKWGPQLALTRARILPRINILKSICGMGWGAHPNTMLTIYFGFIRSVLDYGSTCYGRLEDRVALGFDRLQFAALCVCLGLMKTIPTNVILSLSGE